MSLMHTLCRKSNSLNHYFRWYISLFTLHRESKTCVYVYVRVIFITIPNVVYTVLYSSFHSTFGQWYNKYGCWGISARCLLSFALLRDSSAWCLSLVIVWKGVSLFLLYFFFFFMRGCRKMLRCLFFCFVFILWRGGENGRIQYYF